jgi:hypothetical protein
MNSNKGIFEGFPSSRGNAGQDLPSPFTAVDEDQPLRNPFEAAEPAAVKSPFAAGADEGGVARGLPEVGKPAWLPERRRSGNESPFQVAEPSEGFGFEAPAGGYAAAPFPPPSSPFAVAPEETLAEESERAVPPQIPVGQALQAPPPVASATVAPAAGPKPPFAASSAVAPQSAALDQGFAAWAPLAGASTAAAKPFVAEAPVVSGAASPASAPSPEPMLPESSSSQIRQLELRAIFGVDRELSADEILQRLRSLKGIRNVARVGYEELAAFEILRRCFGDLGQGDARMRVMFGDSPVELVREGRVVLAAMTEGKFAPGVRETIIIGAREIDRLG